MFSPLKFDNQYARLPEEFFHRGVSPDPMAGAAFASLNSDVLQLLGLTRLDFQKSEEKDALFICISCSS